MPPAPTKEGRRSFALPDGSGKLQVFTAMAVGLLQSCAAPPPIGGCVGEEDDEEGGEDEGAPRRGGKAKAAAKKKKRTQPPPKGRKKRAARPRPPRGGEEGEEEAGGEEAGGEEAGGEEAAAKAQREAHQYRHAVTRTAVSLLSSLLTRTLDRPDDPDHRELLEEFVRDLLLLLGRVECLAATLFVTSLGRLLCLRLAPRDDGAAFTKEEQAARVAAVEPPRLDAVDDRGHREAGREAARSRPPKDPDVDEDAQPTDAGENAVCVCGEGYNGEFMLDCDLCHRWFHATCVGVDAAADDSLREEWHCDACRLSTAVLDQRKRIARLLSLHGGDAAGDGGGDDDEGGGEVVDALSSEWEVTKQLLLNCSTRAPTRRRPPPSRCCCASGTPPRPSAASPPSSPSTASSTPPPPRAAARASAAAGGALLPAGPAAGGRQAGPRGARSPRAASSTGSSPCSATCAILRESQTTARQKAAAHLGRPKPPRATCCASRR